MIAIPLKQSYPKRNISNKGGSSCQVQESFVGISVGSKVVPPRPGRQAVPFLPNPMLLEHQTVVVVENRVSRPFPDQDQKREGNSMPLRNRKLLKRATEGRLSAQDRAAFARITGEKGTLSTADIAKFAVKKLAGERGRLTDADIKRFKKRRKR